MMKTKRDIRLLKKCLKKSEQSFDYFTLVVEKIILTYGVQADNYVCLPVYVDKNPYRIYRYGMDGLSYLTKNDEVREVNTIGRLIQAIQLMLDSLEADRY